ncbi:MAG: transcriptional regulator, partial [Alphaproteobacteria bacterium]|nr:transcriptional regulator [Alphaproteobacteria bacterium]
MTPKLIKSKEDFNRARSRLAALMEAREGSPEADELELLALLIEKYEQ